MLKISRVNLANTWISQQIRNAISVLLDTTLLGVEFSMIYGTLFLRDSLQGMSYLSITNTRTLHVAQSMAIISFICDREYFVLLP